MAKAVEHERMLAALMRSRQSAWDETASVGDNTLRPSERDTPLALDVIPHTQTTRPSREWAAALPSAGLSGVTSAQSLNYSATDTESERVTERTTGRLDTLD